MILSCSSDNKVVLSSVPSLSSEPYKNSSENDNEDQTAPVAQPDRVIKIFEDHEDSVYMCDWSSADPWIFASLSYDGRLVINKVPKEEKYNILL